MDAADQLVEEIFSWIEKRECCADKLIILAQELESLREKCNAGECVGSSVTVIGCAALIGAGVATLCTGGAAAPLLALGAWSTGTGAAISVGTKIIESFLSGSTLKEAQKAGEDSNKLANNVQKLFDKLKTKTEEMNSFADPGQLDQHISAEIQAAVARRYGLKVNIPLFSNEPEYFMNEKQVHLRPAHLRPAHLLPAVIPAEIAAIRNYFGLVLQGEGAEKLIKNMAQAAIGRGVLVAGGVGMIFALHEAFENWTDLIKKNHVTEASQSLRDTAKQLRVATRELRQKFNKIKKVLEEMDRRQREHEKQLERDRNTRAAQKSFVLKIHWLARHQKACSKSHKGQSQRKKQEYAQSKRRTGENEQKHKHNQTADGQQGGGDRGDPDSDDEENDQGNEESDSEETEDDESSDETNKKQHFQIKIGFLNVRSILRNKDKRRKVKTLVEENSTVVFLPVETWLNRDTRDEVLHEALPETFISHRWDRQGRGGGVVVAYSNVLQGTQIQFTFPTTFEYVAVELQHDEWDQPLLVINLYHRTARNLEELQKFLDELKELLDEAYESHYRIIVAGDFNIHFDNPRPEATQMFKRFLERNGLVQHVQGPTHRAGHTLDLVLSRNVNVFNVDIQGNKISDHQTILFDVFLEFEDSEEESETDEDEDFEKDEQKKRYKRKEE